MQGALFPETDDPTGGGLVEAAAADPALTALAASLPPQLRLGTSSWHYPGWRGLVWQRDYPASTLSRYGLPAYARHPLLRSVGIDRGFYRPLTTAQFAQHAAQVPADFRFVVKAPAAVTDALVRDEGGRGQQANPDFLDPGLALRSFVEPALAGLGGKLGAMVFQISPLPGSWLLQMPELLVKLGALLRVIPDLRDMAPDAVVAVEVRDPHWLTPQFADLLRATGATYCLGLHARMPPVAEQLPLLRALWPGPLVCRWNLNPLHGAFGFEEAERLYQPYDRLVDPDRETRLALAKVIAGTVGAGQRAYVTLSNKAEGCAPLSVAALAQAVHEQRLRRSDHRSAR